MRKPNISIMNMKLVLCGLQTQRMTKEYMKVRYKKLDWNWLLDLFQLVAQLFGGVR